MWSRALCAISGIDEIRLVGFERGDSVRSTYVVFVLQAGGESERAEPRVASCLRRCF